MNLPIKYRPKRFEEVVGQEHVTRTLQNALRSGRIAHAYLFAGPRGVGKTTTARLLAKGLNCEHGPTPEPCNKCVMCREIDEGRSLDVVEIDGASNRGIDEIRNLREQVKFLPTRGRYRVFIIDEVHMLTTEAFNALLKTLEEPPPHVVFVLATTEPRKLPETVISRTQRFDFRPLTEYQIAERLRHISDNEGIEIEDKALMAIARHAEGSLRDAVALLEQLSVFSEGKVKAHDVFTMLGVVEDEFFVELFNAIYERDTRKAMELLDSLFQRGYSARDFVKGFQHAADRLLKARLNMEENPYSSIASRYMPQDILAMLRTSLKMEETIRYAPQPRIWIEYHVLRLIYLPNTIQLANMLERAGYTILGEKPSEIPAAAYDKPVSIEESPQSATLPEKATVETKEKSESEKIADSLSSENQLLSHLITDAGQMNGDELHVQVQNDIEAEMIEGNIEVIKRHAREVLDREIDVRISRISEDSGDLKHPIMEHPHVKKLVKELKLEVINHVQTGRNAQRGAPASEETEEDQGLS